MSGTTGDLAELSLQVNYETVSRASTELQTFQGRATAASRETDSFNSAQTRLDQSLQGLTRTMGLQSQQLALLLPQYQGYVRYAEEMQRATLQLTLEQTKYVTALRDVEPVLRNLGLFNREFSTEVVTSYERLQQLSRQLGTTATSYRELAEASKLLTTNLAEQRNIQQQFIQAFTGQGQNGAQARQRLEDYIGPLGDQSSSEAMSRFAERLRAVRDVAVQTRDAMAVLGTTSMDTVRNLERLASVDIGAQARLNLAMQGTIADNQVRYQAELTRLNAAATAAQPTWWVGQAASSLMPNPLAFLERNAPSSSAAGFARGVADLWNTPGASWDLQLANGANNLEFQTNRRVAEFNTFLQRNIGGSLIGRGLIDAANWGPFGMPSLVSTAAMVPGAYDWLSGRETPGISRPTFTALNTAPLQALTGIGGMAAAGSPEVAAQLARLQFSQQLNLLNEQSGGALDEAIYLNGVGINGNASGASVRNQNGLRGRLQGDQQLTRNLIRDLAAAPGGQFMTMVNGFGELRAGQVSRQASDFMGGSAQRTIDEINGMAEAAMAGTQAVAMFQARLSDENATRAFRGTSGQIINGFQQVAQASADAARASQFGTQVNAFLATGPAAARQLSMAQMAQGLGGWTNPLAQQQAALAFERDDMLATVPAAYSNPADQEQARLRIAETYNRRTVALSQLFNLQQGERISQQLAQSEMSGLGVGLTGIDASRFGIAQQMVGLNPAYFSTDGRFDVNTFRSLLGGNTSMMPQGMQELFQQLMQNAQAGIAQQGMMNAANFAGGNYGGVIQGWSAAGGPAALRAAQAQSGAMDVYLQNASNATGVPLPLLRAIAMQESRLGTDPNAGNNVMQFTQGTWNSFTGLPISQRDDRATNVMQAARYIQSFGFDLSTRDGWTAAIRRYNGGGDPNYVQNVNRWLDPDAVASLSQQGFTAGQVGGARFQAQAANGVLQAMRAWTAGGNRTGTFESNMQGIQQALSQGVTDPSAIQALITAANDAATAMARLNLERETFNSQQELDGYRKFNEVMIQTGGNIDLARAAMERFVAARRAGISESEVGSARGIQALTGIARLGVEEQQRGQTLGQSRDLAALEYGSFGLPDRERQVMLSLAQEDMRFNTQVNRLRANVDTSDTDQVAAFDAAYQQAQNVYNTNRATIADTARLRGALQDAQRAQEMLLEPLRSALKNMQTEAANFWRVLLEGGQVTGKDLEKLFGNIFKNAAAQLLGSFSTNLIAGTAFNVMGLGSFGSQLGIPDMSSLTGTIAGGASMSGGSLGLGLSSGSFGSASGAVGGAGGLFSALFGSGSAGTTQSGVYSPGTFQRGGYMSGLNFLTPFVPLIANATGISQLNGLGAMQGINTLMGLNTGGQGLFSWGGLTTAGNNMFNQSTWLDRMAPSLFSNGANVALASNLGTFGSAASSVAPFADAAGAFGGLYGLGDVAAFGQSASNAASGLGGTAGALGMTGAQALSGLGAVAGVANFAMNPTLGSGISAAGGVMSALAAYGAIGSAFGPIGAAVGVIGALVSMSMDNKKKGYSGASAQIGVKDGLLDVSNVGGKGMDVSSFNNQLREMADNVNKANSELNLTISQDMGTSYVGAGQAAGDIARRGLPTFDTSNPYLSLAQGGYLERGDDPFFTSILQNRRDGFNINMSSVDNFANAVRFYDSYYKSAIDTNIAPTSLVQQQRDLRSSYLTGKSQANFYGFDQGLIDTGYRTRFNEDTRRGLLQATNPMGAALEDFDKLAAERLETARTIGADINQVERLNGEERKKIVEQYMGGITNAFRSALKALTQGDIAGETDLAKYNASLAAYGTLLQKYPSASTEDQGRFIEQAMTLVGNARSLFSDTPEFAAVYQRVLADLLQLAPEGSDEGSAAAAALKRLQAGYGGTISSLSALPNNQGTTSGAATPATSQSMADLVASSPIGKDVAAGLAPGLVSLGELISSTNAILREMLDEQRTTNNYIKARIAQ